MIRNAWKKVARSGISPSMDARAAKRIVMANKMSAITGMMGILTCFVLLGMGIYGSPLVIGPVGVGFLLTPLLNRSGHGWAARMYYICYANLSLFGLSYYFGKDTGIYFHFFNAMLTTLLVIGKEERKSFVFGIGLSAVCLIWVGAHDLFGGERHVVSPHVEKVLFLAAQLTAVIMVLSRIHNFSVGTQETENALAEAVEAAKAADTAKSSFLANMSHEIRTPMNGILGLSDLLSRSDLPARHRESVQAIRSSARDLLEIINEILDLSKIEAGKMHLEKVSFDLGKLIDSLRLLFSPQAEGKGLYWKVEASPDLPHRLLGDPVRVRQVITNLIGNAFKFTHEGGVTLRIRSGSIAGDGAIPFHFEVEDTGVGIPEEARPRIFQAFSQADESTTRKFGGTGLGLHICRQIVEMMGGSIGFESAPGKGSRFHFTVPIPPAPEGAAETAGAEAQAGRARSFAAGLRLLIVDDHPINRQVLAGMLEMRGLKADEAKGGRDALERCSRQAYDLVFMDSHMPDVDGFRCTRTLREAETAEHRTVIVGCTADAMSGSRERCLIAGMDDMITKPVLEERLDEVLAHWLPRAATEADQAAREAIIHEAHGAAMDGMPGPGTPSAPAWDATGGPDWIDAQQLSQLDRWSRNYDPEFWNKTLSEFQNSYKSITASIRTACAAGDFPAAADDAHTLKGVSSMLGFRRMSDICKGIEALGSGGDTSGWPELAAELEASLEPSLAEMRQLVKA